MDALQKIIIAFELHDVAGIKEGFRNGVNPNMIHKGNHSWALRHVQVI
ncbi:MAG: hypothetical protein IPP61_15805 [Cytophagaceae bacterium]|nr:hypothetical protein [Cytophagaceae bacterium]MBL0326615.1 hypothetical protein [Cytophagaceae bacterium]